jgi:hypothetical protein
MGIRGGWISRMTARILPEALSDVPMARLRKRFRASLDSRFILDIMTSPLHRGLRVCSVAATLTVLCTLKGYASGFRRVSWLHIYLIRWRCPRRQVYRDHVSCANPDNAVDLTRAGEWAVQRKNGREE